MFVTEEYLRSNPDSVFVFGDNILRRGFGGAAFLRNEPNTYGVITKKKPTNENDAFYRPEEYLEVYKKEIQKLKIEIANNPEKTYLISRLGAGLANRFLIFENVIEPNLHKDLGEFGNVEFV
jgi:hypothetical protein